jgi:hypothetical protein
VAEEGLFRRAAAVVAALAEAVDGLGERVEGLRADLEGGGGLQKDLCALFWFASDGGGGGC